MALESFNLKPYNITTNPKGYEILTPADLVGASVGVYQGDTGDGGYVDPTSAPGGSIPAGQVIATDNPVVTGVSALTSFTIRVRKKDDPSDQLSGWLVDPRGCRFVNADNTGVNTDGNTLQTDAGVFTDGQFIYLVKVDVVTNAIITANVPATITGVSPIVNQGGVSPYIDLTLNPKPVAGDEGELDRDVQYKYRLVVESELPARYYSADSGIAT